MVGLVAPDFVLRLVMAGVVGMALVVEIAGMDLDDPSAGPPGLGLPAAVVAGLERRRGMASVRGGKPAAAAVQGASMLESAADFQVFPP